MRLLEVCLVRHAASIHDAGIVPPRDPEADTGNRAALTALAESLPSPATWWVSPLRRCRMTAEALLEAGLEAGDVVHDDRLAEQDYGEYHGMAVEEVWEKVKDGPRSEWHFLHPEHRPPGGESFAMLHDRIRPVIADLEAAGPGSLVVVSHAMVIRSMLAHAMGLTMEQSLALNLGTLSLTRLAHLGHGASGGGGAGGWTLRSLNQVFG